MIDEDLLKEPINGPTIKRHDESANQNFELGGNKHLTSTLDPRVDGSNSLAKASTRLHRVIEPQQTLYG
jgi:hypothetical protein